MKSRFVLGIVALVAGAAATVEGAIWNADTTLDVGNSIVSASVTDGSGSLDKIQGKLVATFTNGNVSWDQDIYCIHITDGTAFSAFAYPSAGLPLGGAKGDFNLALFDVAGHGIAFNDNNTLGNGIDPNYPMLTNTFTSSLAAGDYYIAISRNTTGTNALRRTQFTRPVVAGGALMFPGQINNAPAADPTAALRAVEYSNMSGVFTGWEAAPFNFPFNDNYDIDLTGASFSVPSPAGLSVLGLGLVGFARRRR